jgi:hypothetical protein
MTMRKDHAHGEHGFEACTMRKDHACVFEKHVACDLQDVIVGSPERSRNYFVFANLLCDYPVFTK